MSGISAQFLIHKTIIQLIDLGTDLGHNISILTQNAISIIPVKLVFGVSCRIFSIDHCAEKNKKSLGRTKLILAMLRW